MMSMTPDQFRKVGLGVVPSPSPFFTPRPEKRRMDPRGVDCNFSRQEKDREVNVQVILRCRPLGEEEQRLNVPKVILCNEHKREINVLQSVANKQVDRLFTFDKVFGPKSQQRSIYDQAIAPIVNEVLDGFNCTVFAYGQTGTGKTYTMEGGMRKKGGELPADAGVIPRAVRHIFETLESQNADYNMKVTFLELYNEEITDLLAPEESPRCNEERQKKPISLMEDGKGCVNVRGLEEEAVYSANEIYNLLERGAAKRKTADTLLNKRSSRSHAIFSITVYIRETAIGDEDVIKCGKLNLVDLAGSENISRSGAREGRAREAGEINKSLLTLGRVINALVEHSVHIPYRDSKLTRLLRDSLGGKTKTCIIATISPSALSLEETLSTLDYAHRAKNIRNKPEANQKLSKAVLLKDLYMEIERMKQDVRAAREKNGVYVPHERYAQDEAEKQERNIKIDQLEADLELSKKQGERFRGLYLTEQEQKMDRETELNDCKMILESTNKVLSELQDNYTMAISTLKEKDFTISKLLQSENAIVNRAKELRADLQHASDDVTSLFGKLDQKNKIEATNHDLVLSFGSELDHTLKDLHKVVTGSISQQEQHLRCLEENVCSFLANKCDATQVLELRINKMSAAYISGAAALNDLAHTLKKKASSDLEQQKSTILSQTNIVENFLCNAVLEAKEVICDIQNSLKEQKQLLYISTQKQQEGIKRSVASTQEVSKATLGFLDELHHRASKVMNILEQSQIEKSRQLAKFENIFKDEAAKEEKQAMEKITEILGTLTIKRTTMVSEASKNIQNSSTEENLRLQQEMSNMQQVSTSARSELSNYVEKVKSHLLEDTFSQAETKTIMESCLQECSNKVVNSREQWENAKSFIDEINERSIADIEDSVEENICTNNTVHENFIFLSTSLEAELDVNACDILEAVNESLKIDHETKKEIDTMSNACINHLKSIQEKHIEYISNIRNQTEQKLKKDYLVDQNAMPENRVMAIPSLASIEEMKTGIVKNSISDSRLERCLAESKIPQQKLSIAASPNRSPFTDVN